MAIVTNIALIQPLKKSGDSEFEMTYNDHKDNYVAARQRGGTIRLITARMKFLSKARNEIVCALINCDCRGTNSKRSSVIAITGRS